MLIRNPYRPGAGHMPPFLAGRHSEQYLFKRLLHQTTITENILITGLRGYGKTVLLEHMRGLAESTNWLWIGNDLSESSSLTEERLALRVLTDVAGALAARFKSASPQTNVTEQDNFAFDALKAQYEQTPGLPSDKLRAVLFRVVEFTQRIRLRGVVLAYDEAQCLSDRAESNEFPMSMLVETVAAIQKRSVGGACLLALSGLPQVFDALTMTRTYTERMFHVMTLERLSREETWAAIATPISALIPPLYAPRALIEKAANMTGGYPYLIQFFGRELVEQMLENGGTLSADQFPSAGCFERLDAGLFSARWNRTTDKQRELLALIARRPRSGAGRDFSAREIDQLRDVTDQMSGNTTAQLTALCDRGMIYRTRHGYYAFTVPMSEEMIDRRMKREQNIDTSWMNPPGVNDPNVMAMASMAPRERPKRRSWFN